MTNKNETISIHMGDGVKLNIYSGTLPPLGGESGGHCIATLQMASQKDISYPKRDAAPVSYMAAIAAKISIEGLNSVPFTNDRITDIVK